MNRFEISFNAKLENISIMRNIIAGFLINKNVTISFIDEVKTIASEAITNAIVHGYKENEEEIIKCIIELNNEEIILHFIDNGVGIENVEEAKKPLFSTKKNEERSGLGFTIMEIFSDEMQVISRLNEGCHVIIHKKFNV